jgi:hypothetical protein
MILMNRRKMLLATGTGGLALATVGLSEGCNASSWITTAINDLPTILSIVESIIGIVGAAQGSADPAALALAQKLAGEANTDLQTLQAIINGYNASPTKTTDLQKIDALLLSVQSNLAGVEGALHITSPAIQAAISAGISAALVIIVALQSLIPPPAVPAPVPAPAGAIRQNRHAELYAAAKSGSQAAVIKAGYNTALAAAGASQFAVR